MSSAWTVLDAALRDGTLQRLLGERLSHNEIAARLGVSRDSYGRWRKRGSHGQEISRGQEILRGHEKRCRGCSDCAMGGSGSSCNPGNYPGSAPQFGANGLIAPDVGHVATVITGGAPKPERTIADDITERKERAEVASLKGRLKDALAHLEQCRYELGVATQVDAARHDVEPIERREHVSALREATACALASDWHIEEHVDRASVNGVNEYNLVIARQRAARFFSGFSYLTRYHQDHFQIRNGLLWLGGDLITGYLREENLESNELSPVQAIAELHTWIAAGIRQYLDETQVEELRVICNSGNHGRLTEKTRPSTREANSIEWLLYVGLAREFAGEERVKFVLPQGSQTYVQIYDWTIRFTHGDETKFGGGVGGIMIPIRKAIAKWQTVRPAHATAMGHYHQEYFLRDLLVNGSLIGYNNYALSVAAPYEDPRQSFFLVDSRRFISMPATIWVTDHEAT